MAHRFRERHCDSPGCDWPKSDYNCYWRDGSEKEKSLFKVVAAVKDAQSDDDPIFWRNLVNRFGERLVTRAEEKEYVGSEGARMYVTAKGRRFLLGMKS